MTLVRNERSMQGVFDSSLLCTSMTSIPFQSQPTKRVNGDRSKSILHPWEGNREPRSQGDATEHRVRSLTERGLGDELN
jgi:hypothetical protein